MANRPSLTVGVDLGGTKLRAALVDATGRVLVSEQRATLVAAGFDGVAGEIGAAVRACIGRAEGAPVLGVGVGVAGQVVAETGVVSYAPNLFWRDAPLRARLEHELGLPVAVLNDVRAATWGEWRHGAGQGVEDLVVVFVGTGIGGGVVSGGRLLTGCTNMAGELGHLTIVAGGRPCRCGNLGCLEAYAGGWAIALRAREETRPPRVRVPSWCLERGAWQPSRPRRCMRRGMMVTAWRPGWWTRRSITWVPGWWAW